MTGWTLAAAELRIPWGSSLAAHRMLVLVTPEGEAVRQINGLASWFDPASGRWRHKPIGYLSSDRLRGYDTLTHPRTFLPVNGVALGSRRIDRAIARGDVFVLETGLTETAAEAVLAPALDAMRRINALSPGPEGGAGLPYPFMGFGRNSNSFFSTLIGVMGFAEPQFARPAHIVPGARAMLLPAADMEAIRARRQFPGASPGASPQGLRRAV